MESKRTRSEEEHDRPEPVLASGKDEMNLAEFPFASLRRRGDSRDAIVHEGWVVDKENNRQHQKWTVRGLVGLGLPTEFDERVYVALMAISAERGFTERKTPFSVYRVLRVMGEDTNKKHYQLVEVALDRLKGVTIKAEGAFWDHEKKELVKTVMAFNLIDKYWLRYREGNAKIREEEGVPGYIVWGEDIWKSIKANYIKPLDIAFFYSLNNPTSRRLYRFLDKRMHFQATYEIDIFELASRLGMVRYAKAAWVKRKLDTAFDELISRGFLAAAKVVKHRTQYKEYTRIRFVKAPTSASDTVEQHDDAQDEAEAYQDLYIARLTALRQRYGITDELVDIWEEALVEIKGATTASTFHTWFTQTHLLAVRDHIALIGVPNDFTQEWLAGHMTPVIKRALGGAVGHPVDELSFQVVTLPKAED